MSTFDLCKLKPPPEPDKPSQSFAERIQKLKSSCPAYKDYVERCVNSSTTDQPVTQTSTTERSTTYNTTSTDFNGTTSVTNFPLTSPTGLNTNNQLDSGTGSSHLEVIIPIVIILILIVAVIALLFLYRKFKRRKDRNWYTFIGVTFDRVRKTVSRHVTKQGHGDIAKENKNVAATRYSKTSDGNNESVQVHLMDEKSRDSNNVNIDSENNLSEKGSKNKEIETDIHNYNENNSWQGIGKEEDTTSGQYNTNHGFIPDMDVNVDSENNFSNSSEKDSENKEIEISIHNYNENNSQQGIGIREGITSGLYSTNHGFTSDTAEKLNTGTLHKDENSSAESNEREERKQVSDKNSENKSEDGKLSAQKPEENEISLPSVAFQNDESLSKDTGSNEEHLPIKSDSVQNNESPATDVKNDEKEQSPSSPVNSNENSVVSESGLPTKTQDRESLKSDLKLPLQQSEDVKNVDHQISTESGYGSQMSSPLTPEITVM